MLKLYAPGRRGRYYYVVGRINGKLHEVSTGTIDKHAAEKFKNSYESGILKLETVQKTITFAAAAADYIAWRTPSKRERAFLENIKTEIGRMNVDAITQSHIVATANALYPSAAIKPATKNRAVIRPIAAVLHYAAECKMCDYIRVRTFKEPPAVPRPVTMATANQLTGATSGIKHLLILWLFRHGDRISDALRVEGVNIDCQTASYKMHVGKTDRWRTMVLDDDVITAMLAHFIDGIPSGYIFPWRTRHQVYRWLRPLCRELDVSFTPHQARHSVGSWMHSTGADRLTIGQRLGHANSKSTDIYIAPDQALVRAAGDRIKKALKQ